MTRLIGLVMVALCLACSGSGDEDAPSGPTLYEVRLGALAEHRPAPMFGKQPPRTLLRVLRGLGDKLDEDTTRGLFVRLEEFAGDWAQAHEVRALIARYRDAGKPVHCHFDDLDNAGYLVAAACDRLSMTPSGTLNLVGLAAQLVHARDALENLGLRAEFARVGRFKGAAEPLTRQQASPEVRQNMDALLDDLDRTFREGLASRAGLDELQPLIDAGPYASKRALASKLIDALAYDDAARAKAKEASEAERVQVLFEREDPEPPSLSELLEAFSGPEKKRHDDTPRMAVVYLVGEIHSGNRAAFDRAASEPFVRAVRKLADDEAVKAVVLRVDSPGGSAMASDRMWHALRRLAKRKPVVVSVGSMAASGGYYIAAAGTEIWAAPNSLVGSIGVVGGKISVARLVERAGLHSEVLPRGAHAAWLSPLKNFDESEREALQALLARTYDRFLHRVSLGRGRPVAELKNAAEGRVMTGDAGKAVGLVDQLGTFEGALARARELGQLPDDAPVQLWPSVDDPLAQLTGALGQARTAVPMQGHEQLRHALLQGLDETLGRQLGAWLVLAREPVAATLPFALSVR